MEFRQLIISQKSTSQRFIFNNKVNLVSSTLLSDELLKPNYDLVESDYVLESEESLPLAETFQVKIRIAQTGLMMIYFKKEVLSPEQKEELIKKIGELKDGIEPTNESQRAKIGKVLEIVAEYNPIFVCFANTGDFIFTRLTFEEILNGKETAFPVLVLLTSLGFADEIPSKKKKSKPVNKVKMVSSGKFDFSVILEGLKNMDYIFFGVFSLFILFGLVLSIFEIQNQDALSAFILVLTVVFIITLYFAVYKASKDEDKYEISVKNLAIPAFYIVLGATLGIVLGYVVTTFVIKVKEEIEINYILVYVLSIIVGYLVSLASIFAPLAIGPLVAKLKKKK